MHILYVVDVVCDFSSCDYVPLCCFPVSSSNWSAWMFVVLNVLFPPQESRQRSLTQSFSFSVSSPFCLLLPSAVSGDKSKQIKLWICTSHYWRRDFFSIALHLSYKMSSDQENFVWTHTVQTKCKPSSQHQTHLLLFNLVHISPLTQPCWCVLLVLEEWNHNCWNLRMPPVPRRHYSYLLLKHRFKKGGSFHHTVACYKLTTLAFPCLCGWIKQKREDTDDNC